MDKQVAEKTGYIVERHRAIFEGYVRMPEERAESKNSQLETD